MKIILVPSTVQASGPRHFQYSSSAVLNDTVAVDAGCLGYYLSAQEQGRIRHVLLTHTHTDHTATLPIFVENAYEGKADCVTVHGSQHVLDSCQTDLFNNRIWPDFIALSRDNDKPFLKLNLFDAGQTIELDGLRFTAVALDHVVPTVGYIVADQNASVAFVSDTGPTEAVWEAANAAANLKAVFVEACFPNRMEWLAKVSKHLTPTMLAGELKKLHRPARIIIVHIKARFQDEVLAELKALGNPQLEIAQFGVPYSF